MLSDITKILQLIRSNLLVERKITLSANVPIILMGGNTAIPGLIDKVINYTKADVKSIASLFQGGNSYIPELDLLRIITAISLATWDRKLNRINLYNYRIKEVNFGKLRVYLFLGIGIALSLFLNFIIYSYYEVHIIYQNTRNTFLTTNINLVDVKLKPIRV